MLNPSKSTWLEKETQQIIIPLHPLGVVFVFIPELEILKINSQFSILIFVNLVKIYLPLKQQILPAGFELSVLVKLAQKCNMSNMFPAFWFEIPLKSLGPKCVVNLMPVLRIFLKQGSNCKRKQEGSSFHWNPLIFLRISELSH